MSELKENIVNQEDETCSATGYQSSTVCVPVTVTPFARVGATATSCCGDPVISSSTRRCTGSRNGSCSFIISQRICVTVPVEFGASAAVDSVYVSCDDASAEDICENCGEEDSL